MTLVGQPPPSPALQQAFALLAQGQPDQAEAVVKRAAMQVKAQHGSGSHPLALAYAELARLHLLLGQPQKAAREFLHAANSRTSTEPHHLRDRLAFQFGLGTALGELGQFSEAERVLRAALELARQHAGPQAAITALARVPLADVYLLAGRTAEAIQLASEAYDTLWSLGDPVFPQAVGTRAEALKATGHTANPFPELNALPDELITAAVAHTLGRAGKGDVGRVRAVLVDLLAFVDQRFGDGHPTTCDVLAAVVHHETASGDRRDDSLRQTAVRRSVWSYTVRHESGGLLQNLEVRFEPTGELHLVPHLSREPTPHELGHLERLLHQAVDDLYARPVSLG